MNEFYFRRSVVLLADHNKEGSFGLVMNKPIDMKFNELLAEFPAFDARVFLGGPVKTDNLYFIHTLGEAIPRSLKIIEGLYWGGDIDYVKDLISGSSITTNQIRFYLGYAGWGPKQLESELEEFSWVIGRAKSETLLKAKPDNMWATMVKKLGPEYAEWVNYPIDPSLN